MRFLRRKRHCNACGRVTPVRKYRGYSGKGAYRVCRSCGPYTWRTR